MRIVSRFAFALLACGMAAGAVAGTYSPSLDRGRALYERHCTHCHTETIHSRPNKLPLTRDELLGIVDHFRRSENLGWTPEEIDDVVEYLNRTRYHFAPQPAR